MTPVFYIYCHYCGEPLENHNAPYCNSCNLYLCYRAMPFLLGMLLTGQLGAMGITDNKEDSDAGYDDERLLVWE